MGLPGTERHKTREYVTALIGSLMRGAYTPTQLAVMTGYSTNNTGTWIQHFHDMGLCYIHSWEEVRSNGSVVARFAARFAWTVGEPFSCIDAEKPRVKHISVVVKPTVRARYLQILEWLAVNKKARKQDCATALGYCNATVYRAVCWNNAMQQAAALQKSLPNYKPR